MPTAALPAIFNSLSLNVLPKDYRLKLSAIDQQLNQLLYLDELGEIAFDRDTLIRIASNPDLVPEQLRDVVVLETSKHLGRRVRRFSKGARLSWAEGEKYGVPIKPLQASDFRQAGISKTSSIQDITKALKASIPDIPKFLMVDDINRVREDIIQRLTENRSVWDCLVANLGWWVAVSVIGFIIVFLSLLALGWQTALAVAAIYVGFVTAYFFLQCLLNTDFQQP